MKFKKTLTTLLFSVMLVVSTAACSTSTQKKPESSTTSSVVSEIQTSNDTSKTGSFDFDEVCKNIVINGKHYTFPFSVKELGEGYSLGDISYSKLEKDDKYYSVVTDLYYNNVEIASVAYYGITEEEKNSNINFLSKKINYLDQSSSIHKTDKIYVEIGGIKLGDDAQNVLNKLGVATENKSIFDGCGSYIYSNDKYSLTYTYMDYNIDSITLSD